MELDTTLVLMLLGAGLVALVATALELSPWWMFTLASAAGAVILVFAAQELSESCWSGTTTGTDGRLFGILAVASLVLYAAAALRAVIDGVRLGKAGDRDAAVARYVACPLASILAGGVVFYAVLAAALHCIN
jgi:hypothetical protein